jgi:hypothetical protein
MKSPVFDFKSIKRILDRQEQKAEFEEKNPPIPDTSMYGWPYGVAVPLKSMAHPEWPYAGTGFEWSKFVKVKI